MQKRDTPIEREVGPGTGYIRLRIADHSVVIRRPWPFEALELFDYLRAAGGAVRHVAEDAKGKEDPEQVHEALVRAARGNVALMGVAIRWLWADPIWELDSGGQTRDDKGLSAIRGMIEAGWSQVEVMALYRCILEICTDASKTAPDGNEVDKLVNFGLAEVRGG